MDTALAIKDKHKYSDMFVPRIENRQNGLCWMEEEENINPTIAGILFACVSEYEYLHSGVLLVDAIVKAIKVEVPGIGDYI